MIAILSDIHGNIHALDAVLADMPNVSEIWVLGDTVGGGPFPCECLDRLLNLSIPVISILGNWEEWLLEGYKGLHPEWWEGKQFATGAWTVDHLKPYHWTYLEGLSKTLSLNSVSGGALLYHGSPEKSDGTILAQETAAEAAADHKEKWLLGGHVHRTRLFRVGYQRVAAVGSVGLSLDKIGGVACYTLLDRDHLVFRHVAYDLNAAIVAYKNSDYMKNVPYFSHAGAMTMITGLPYVGKLIDFINEYVLERLGYKPENIPEALCVEAAQAWKVEGWLEEMIK